MNWRHRSGKLYLLLVYFSLVALLLYFFPRDAGFPEFAAFTLLLVLGVVYSYEPLLRAGRQITGYIGGGDEHAFFSAFIELNKKIHKFLQADDVLTLVDDALKEKVRVRRTVILLNTLFKGGDEALVDMKNPRRKETNELRCWPDASRHYAFLGEDFSRAVLEAGKVFAVGDVTGKLREALEESDTGLAIPIVQNRRLLCVILVGRIDNSRPYSEFEYQMFNYLANQLSIVLDRIRVYEQVMQKTVMDHAEKMQVMQSLSANIAHEMRTPLSGIRASITGIESYLPDLIEAHDYARAHAPQQFPAIRENHLATLRVTPSRITLMIDQANAVIDMLLMNLRDNSLDRRQFSQCSAADCVRQAVDRYPFKTGEREKVKLSLEEDFNFLGVEILFIYIMFNMLKNALYSIRSAQKGEITIRLRRGESHNQVLFRDTGEGIDAAILERIFEGFFTTKADGTGAGLAFCRRTVRSFGGDVECESVRGDYAEFKISLPAAALSAAPGSPSSSPAENPSRR